ncbi:MAG: hypothetical protein A2271_00410 [Candidatus Moranbacteria bacterium RIFOXYA12_FULL_35_19]|nr:MAG: hypothetical protein UR78_C0009G0034 [Candidatus Moranbacteria bacterium GW2011_GWF2_35_39]OGI31184.1 MAG: hypothetical protein A2343_00620 [Candidatus Moranbacteria bacterium RIFOXYB12_FULL_35_8]OGI32755.1 MAG: hypothetical protein A2489_02465 [Candidatus Moranbacteria bacterium RIFOXYC12_FULL_36_13]OGI35180.1 MAG: hypothetical protein A2271_00410 [Candidatus Moranbacteria bacterium RIFOXYA12_FULL_35_19]
MHSEILSEKQAKFLGFLRNFSSDFGLVGGTAIALQIGHRQSIDFDLASLKEIKTLIIRKKILEFGKIEAVLVDNQDEYTLIVDGIKFTFFNYPYPLKFSQDLNGIIFMPDIETLSAMKAYALGRRAKWKDYVDLYFIAEKLGSIDPIIEKAKEIFGLEFDEKNFRIQLAYFEDIDYSEKVIFSKGFEVSDEKIKKKLLEYSI